MEQVPGLAENTNTHPEGYRPSNLSYIKLQNAPSFADYVLPILRLCPKLETLALAPCGKIPRELLGDDLVQIFELCPELHYFMYHPGVWVFVLQTVFLGENNDVCDGVQTFDFSGELQMLSSIIPVFVKTQHTLKCLRLKEQDDVSYTADGNLSALFRLHFPRLERLRLQNVHIQPGAWVDFLAGVQNIQYVTLLFTPITDRILLQFSKLRWLNELTLRWPEKFDGINVEALLKFADNLRATDSHLKHLELLHFCHLNDQVLVRLANVRQLSQLVVMRNNLITMTGVEHFCSSNEGKSLTVALCTNVEDGSWVPQSGRLYYNKE